MTESDILYETGAYWVLQVRTGYEVYRSGVTHSTRCAVIGYRGAVGLAKARAEADRRAASNDKE